MSRALEMALVGAGSSRRGGRRNPIDAPVIIGGAILAGLLVWALWPKSSATSKGSGTGGSTNPPLVTPPSNLGGTAANSPVTWTAGAIGSSVSKTLTPNQQLIVNLPALASGSSWSWTVAGAPLAIIVVNASQLAISGSAPGTSTVVVAETSTLSAGTTPAYTINVKVG